MALIINGTPFNDTLTGFDPGNDGNVDGVETINGLAGTDVLSGLGGNDTLNGDGDNDILNGGSGNDAINGGADNDTVNGGMGADALDGGTGSGDMVSYAGSAAGVTVSIVNGSVGAGGDAQGDTINNFDWIIGSSHNDTLTGNADSFNEITGGAGADFMDAGAGAHDLLLYRGSTAGVTISLVDGSIGSGGDAAGDEVHGFENVEGTAFSDALTGNAGANIMEGEGGDDAILGGSGDDNILGGDGNDDLRGDFQSDTLVGGNGNDTLRGNSESDTLEGGRGNDRLIGGESADMMNAGNEGGEGSDSASTDTLSYEGSTAGGVTVNLATGAASGGHAAGDVFSNFENLVGSELNDNLTGDAQNNILVGRAGSDVLSGGLGNDSYDIDAGDTVNEAAGEGTDAIYTAGTFTLGAGSSIEKLVAHTHGGAIDVAGNEVVQTIYGNANDNRVTGGGGGDTLLGGGGNDTYDYNAATDSSLGASNVDSISYGLGDTIDLADVFVGNLTFIGTDPYSGTAGEVRLTNVTASSFVIRVNLDTDLTDEMQIYVVGITPAQLDLLL